MVWQAIRHSYGLEWSKVSATAGTQIVRWRRKPRWFPIAPSKLFRVPKRPVIDPEEHKEIARLFNIYRTQVRAVRHYFYNESIANKYSVMNLNSEQSKLEEEIELNECYAINDEWNMKIAEEREIYLENYHKMKEEKIKDIISKKDKIKLQQLIEIEQSINMMKEAKKGFITSETLDEEIDKCLETFVDYNYAIDLKGNLIKNNQIVEDPNPDTIDN